MSKETETAVQDDVIDSPLVAKLKMNKQAKKGTDSTTLPETGVKATWPQFKPHHIWTKAQRLAKKQPLSMMKYYLALLCKFDGEKMTPEMFVELIPTTDIIHLSEKVMGPEDDDDEDGAEGNALH